MAKSISTIEIILPDGQMIRRTVFNTAHEIEEYIKSCLLQVE